MSKNRWSAKVDINQPDIVKALRKIPGVTVEVGHDDILIGHKGKTFWYEIKSPESVSRKTKKILESKIKDSQKSRTVKKRSEQPGQVTIKSFHHLKKSLRIWG